jgi:hypothetical protein
MLCNRSGPTPRQAHGRLPHRRTVPPWRRVGPQGRQRGRRHHQDEAHHPVRLVPHRLRQPPTPRAGLAPLPFRYGTLSRGAAHRTARPGALAKVMHSEDGPPTHAALPRHGWLRNRHVELRCCPDVDNCLAMARALRVASSLNLLCSDTACWARGMLAQTRGRSSWLPACQRWAITRGRRSRLLSFLAHPSIKSKAQKELATNYTIQIV